MDFTLNDIKLVMEEVFDRKFDEAFDRKFDEKFGPAFDKAFDKRIGEFEVRFEAKMDTKINGVKEEILSAIGEVIDILSKDTDERFHEHNVRLAKLEHRVFG